MIIGHQEQQIILKKILEDSEKGAFLLCGPEGVGKFHTLKEIIKKFGFRDVITINSESAFLRLTTAQLIQKLLSISTKDKRIVIVNDAHKLNKEAQNSLLKSIEEIKDNILLFFITHRLYKIYPTIRSRMQKISFGLVSNEEIKKFLLEKKIEIKTIEILVKIFPGQIGKILNTLEKKEIFNIIAKTYFSNDEASKIFEVLLNEEKIDLKEAVEYLLHLERMNLLKGDRKSIYKIKFLENIFYDSEYFLNKALQLSNIFLNLNG